MCGMKDITIQTGNVKLVREIRNMAKGQVCNYRVKSTCGGPTFTLVPGGTWTSDVNSFNTTFTEFETGALHIDSAANAPQLDSKFIYH